MSVSAKKNPTRVAICCRKVNPFQGLKLGSCLTLEVNCPRRHMCWQSKRFYWERAPGWRAVGEGNPGELLCRVAHSLGWNVMDNLILYWWCFPEDVLRISSNSFPREFFSCLSKVSLTFYSHNSHPFFGKGWRTTASLKVCSVGLDWVMRASWSHLSLYLPSVFLEPIFHTSRSRGHNTLAVHSLFPFCLHSCPFLLLHPPSLGSALALTVIYTASYPCGLSHSVNWKDNNLFW